MDELMKDVDQPAAMRAGLIGGAATFLVGLIGLIPILGCCLIGVPALIAIGTGVLYDRFAIQNGRTLTIQSGAIGGGVAGIGAAIGGVLLSIIGTILGPVIGGMMGGNVDTAAFSIVGLLIGVVMAVAIGVALAAAGGAGYVMLQNRNTGTTPPPV